MLKLTKTGIGLLTKQYRSVLRKCWSINLGLFATTTALSIMVANISSAAYNNDERLIIITRDTYDVDNGYWVTDSSTGNNVAKLYNGWRRGGTLELFSQDGTNSTWIDPFKFSLNNSSYATGIDFAANVTAGTTDASHLATTGAVNQLLNNYYYTKTEADAEYALLESAIEDVDDKVEDVDDKVDAVEAKIGSLNETGIAGNDVATQLKYILENGSTGGTGVTLSTLGYIGANTPYLNTTNNAMNFSSTYTIGGNMSTLANQIKTNENSISALNTRVNNLGTYGGTLELTDNYAKVIGDVSVLRNGEALSTPGINTKAYASEQDVTLKSYTVELHVQGEAVGNSRGFRVQVQATNTEEAVTKAKDEIINNGWSSEPVQHSGYTDRVVNKYMYAMFDRAGTQGEAVGSGVGLGVENMNIAIQATDDVTVTENNYRVVFKAKDENGYSLDIPFLVYVSADNEAEALAKAKELANEGFYHLDNQGTRGNIYAPTLGSTWGLNTWHDYINRGAAIADSQITDGSLGTEHDVLALGNGTIIENIALLDNAIGDLGTTGVSGASVAAQLKLLGEVGSEALGQKIGSWSTTKDSISQTLGEETKNYGYLTAFKYDSENEQYVGTVGDNLQALDTALSLTAKGLDALSYDLYNYYYTFRGDEISEAAEFALFLNNAKLSSVFEA